MSPQSTTSTVLITGATGNIGARLVAEILTSISETRVVAIVRASSQSEAQDRLRHALRVFLPAAQLERHDHRLRVIPGDITCERLGLSPGEHVRLADEVTHIVHAAAATKFQLSVADAERINFQGTVELAAFAQRAAIRNLQQLCYISTAYTCGARGGFIQEEARTTRPEFCNAYEQSKWEAEQFLQERSGEIPAIILRPSIVVGDSLTGATLNFNVLYQPLRMLLRGIIRELPCSPEALLDIVPLDFVARTIAQKTLLRPAQPGTVLHIAAGSDRQTPVGEIVSSFFDYVRERGDFTGNAGVSYRPRPFYSAAEISTEVQPDFSPSAIDAFAPYLQIDHRFDTARLCAHLRDTGIVVPNFASYSRRIFKYCFDCRWGKALQEAA